jgi:peptide/nickel transport system substrate-binding protein
MIDTRNRLSRRKLLKYASFAAAGSVLASCQVVPGGTASSPGESPAKKIGGTLIVGSAAVGTLENSLNLGTPTPRYLYEIYDRLVNQDLSVAAATPPIGAGLATSWEISPDASTYTFKLRQGVTFHDGTPFDADAVKFNIERLTKKDHPFYYERGAGATAVGWGRVAEVIAVDKYTVQLKLKSPYSQLIDLIWRAEYSIASPDNIKKLGNDKNGESPVGTGPFKFVEHQPGVKLTLAKNPNYFGGTPVIDQLVVRVVNEPAALVSALLAGELHLIADRVTPDVAKSLQSNPNVKIQVGKIPGTNNVNLNKKSGVFTDKRVRQAVNYAIDRETYVRDILNGYGVPAKSMFATSALAYDPAAKGYNYDLEKAKALLRDAGLSGGFNVTFWAGNTVPSAVYVKDQLAKIGINVKLELFEAATLSSTANKEGTRPGVDGIFWGWNTNPPQNFDRYFPTSTQPPNGVNWGFYSNPEVDKLVDQAARTIDVAERVKVYQRADVILTEDAPWLYIDHGPLDPRTSVKNLNWVSANEFNYTVRNAYFTE